MERAAGCCCEAGCSCCRALRASSRLCRWWWVWAVAVASAARTQRLLRSEPPTGLPHPPPMVINDAARAAYATHTHTRAPLCWCSAPRPGALTAGCAAAARGVVGTRAAAAPAAGAAACAALLRPSEACRWEQSVLCWVLRQRLTPREREEEPMQRCIDLRGARQQQHARKRGARARRARVGLWRKKRPAGVAVVLGLVTGCHDRRCM
jgi:hypothetical protein